MAYVNLYDAKTNLSRLVDQAVSGEEVIIGKAGKPLVRLVPERSFTSANRRPGTMSGRIVIHDDFDDLPDDLAAAFAGEGL